MSLGDRRVRHVGSIRKMFTASISSGSVSEEPLPRRNSLRPLEAQVKEDNSDKQRREFRPPASGAAIVPATTSPVEGRARAPSSEALIARSSVYRGRLSSAPTAIVEEGKNDIGRPDVHAGGSESFPAVDTGADAQTSSSKSETPMGRLLSKVPHTVWQPNAVVRQHRRKANLYWSLLLVGYLIYIVIVINDSLEDRKNPPVMIRVIDEPFQLPDIGFCFEGDTYGSRFACFDGEADGKDCADSLRGDVFIYGYNYTGYTTPEGYGFSEDYIVRLPEEVSDTCRLFKLSDLSVVDNADSWKFHMLMFWNSSYNATANKGAFESIRMYMYEAGLDESEFASTPISLYAPMSFDATVVPFVRGFLEYEQRVLLSDQVIKTFSILDVTSSSWRYAEDAVSLAADYGTDALASIQVDIRTQSYTSTQEVDPMDVASTLGEISGFWLVVPLLFGALFYRTTSAEDEEMKEMRNVNVCCCQAPVATWRRGRPRNNFEN